MDLQFIITHFCLMVVIALVAILFRLYRLSAWDKKEYSDKKDVFEKEVLAKEIAHRLWMEKMTDVSVMSWGSGEWDTEPNDFEFVYKTYTCLGVRQESPGWHLLIR